MFKVYYYYNCDTYKTTVYAVRRESLLDTVFLVYIDNEWQWINAECCKPCEDEEI